MDARVQALTAVRGACLLVIDRTCAWLLGAQGMTLLGFKPLACLAPWHQLTHSTFWR